MPNTNPPLPAPPEFPVSNASYNKIVGKMHKAALATETAAGAIAAVSMIRDHIGGTNTYAKASRRYADALIETLGGVTAQPTDEQVAKVVSKAAKIDVADKPAIPLKPEPAQAAFTGKTFSNKSNAKRALKALGLDHLPVEFLPGPGGTFMPVVLVDDDKGIAYAAERGIGARVTA